jgi:transcriptional regulator with XRE-family HTH domain
VTPPHTHTDIPPDMSFRSDRIREIREGLKMSQATLAELAAPATQATISRIEKGESNKRPDRALAKRIAHGLGVPLAEIFVETPENAVAVPATASMQLGVYESALLRVLDAEHTMEDVDRAREAMRETLPLVKDLPVPETVAREWVNAARSLRRAHQPATPQAIVARVAMEALLRESVAAPRGESLRRPLENHEEAPEDESHQRRKFSPAPPKTGT